MTNLSPESSRTLDSSSRTAATSLLHEARSHSHQVQFYERQPFLFERVAHFLRAGLEAGDAVFVIATADHRDGFLRQLRASGVAQERIDSKLTLLDASATLNEFMVGDLPDRELFRKVVDRLVLGNAHRARSLRMRAYGEMVDVLWQAGKRHAALRLEELWAEVCQQHDIALLCAYLMSSFGRQADAQRFRELCDRHTHVLPTESFGGVVAESLELREITALQQRARTLDNEIQHRKELEASLRDALWERTRSEESLRASVAREREARALVEASDAFKELFVGALGRDLQHPLSAVLATARSLLLGEEHPPTRRERLESVVSNGERVERMLEQIIDLTRARLPRGIPVERSGVSDMVTLVTRVVDSLRSTNPGRCIELDAVRPCLVSLDRDRFEQVVSNLVGNAIAHGDPTRPIRVTVDATTELTTMSVHNFGAPIEPELCPLLFDPFTRGARARARAEGLGLGLYISERIVRAHGGKISVESNETRGTYFRVVLETS